MCITNVYTYLIALVLLVYVSKLLTRRRYILFSDCRQSSIRELPSNIKGFNPCKNSADSKWRQILNATADFYFSKTFTFLIDHILQSVDRIGWFCVGQLCNQNTTSIEIFWLFFKIISNFKISDFWPWIHGSKHHGV